MTTTRSPFSRRLYQFLNELSENNRRPWFEANKERYISEVRDPMSEFIIAMQEPLHRISPHLNADPRPTGGSMFRIYRDTRFSKDKTPYKTHAACHFRHRARNDVHSIGYYMHLGPGGNALGGGVWRPVTAGANMVRRHIAENTDEWRKILNGTIFKRHFSEIEGEQLKRVPREFDPEHPFADDLRRKDFVVGTNPTNKQVTSPDFIAYATEIYSAMAPFMAFLAAALELEW
jgi:uncharacterized protein (TIGR02453 family)